MGSNTLSRLLRTEGKPKHIILLIITYIVCSYFLQVATNLIQSFTTDWGYFLQHFPLSSVERPSFNMSKVFLTGL